MKLKDYLNQCFLTTDGKFYVCKLCGAKTKTNAGMYRHFDNKHGQRAQSLTEFDGEAIFTKLVHDGINKL